MANPDFPNEIEYYCTLYENYLNVADKYIDFIKFYLEIAEEYIKELEEEDENQSYEREYMRIDKDTIIEI